MAKEIPDIVMSSPEKAKFPASLVPALSTDGQLLCCLQGMIVAQSDPGGKSQSGLLLSSSREKTIAAYAANITMFPEGLKRATCDGTSPKVLSSQKSKHDFESSVDWSKEFSSPLLCSLQQVFVDSITCTCVIYVLTMSRQLIVQEALFPIRFISFIKLTCFIYSEASVIHEDYSLLS